LFSAFYPINRRAQLLCGGKVEFFNGLLSRLFAGISPGNRQQRNQRMAEAHIAYGYTLKEIADFLGVHYTTVSKAVGGRMKK
jgi:hypothetical protein